MPRQDQHGVWTYSQRSERASFKRRLHGLNANACSRSHFAVFLGACVINDREQIRSNPSPLQDDVPLGRSPVAIDHLLVRALLDKVVAQLLALLVDAARQSCPVAFLVRPTNRDRRMVAAFLEHELYAASVYIVRSSADCP